ncbi:hypothetical protein COY27_07240, partial [Candidatus Woesearchaeota archaeon CG_4_10_14_0_2_um_filter_33_13]
ADATSTTCGDINSDLTLTDNITAIGDCFIVNVSDITIDGAGYYVVGNGSGYGINITNYGNVTIQNFGGLVNFSTVVHTSNSDNNTIVNNNFETVDASGSYGLVLDSSSNENYINNNNITTFGGSSYGIWLKSDSGLNTIGNNVINTTGADATAIYLWPSQNNVTFNNIYTTNAKGLIIENFATNNYVLSNNIVTGGVYEAIQLAYFSDNNFFEFNFINSSGWGILEQDANNNTFNNDVINAESTTYVGGSGQNNSFINVSFNQSSISFSSDGDLYVKWYVDVNVTNSTSPLSGANVSIYNYTSELVNNTWTRVTGFTNTFTLTEFWQNSTDTVYSTPHTINTTLAGYTTNSTIINLTETNSTQVGIVLSQSEAGTTLTECGNLTIEGETYNLANNVSSNGTCFNILNDSITLDCNGYGINHSIVDEYGFGVVVSDLENVTIKNCIITETKSTAGYTYGINVNNASGIEILNNSISSISSASRTLYFSYINDSLIENNYLNSGANLIAADFQYPLNCNINNNTLRGTSGLYIDVALNNTISNNDIVVSDRPLYFGGNNNNISNNLFNSTTNTDGNYVYLNGGVNLTFNQNIIASNYETMRVETFENVNFSNNNFTTPYSNSFFTIDDSSISLDDSNLADGLPILYNHSLSNQEVLVNVDLNSTYGAIICYNCTNVTYDNITMGTDGISLIYSENSTITNSTIINTQGHGIYLFNSLSVDVSNNFINSTNNNSGNAIIIPISSGFSILINNTIFIGEDAIYSAIGIGSSGSSNNLTITENRVYNYNPIKEYSLSISNSNYAIITNNYFYNNYTSALDLGLSTVGHNVSNNTFSTEDDSRFAINLYSSNSVVYGNSGVVYRGISIAIGENNSIYDNNFNTTAYGFVFESNSHGHRIYNNTLNVLGEGITVISSNNQFENNLINVTSPSGYGLYLTSGYNNSFTSDIIECSTSTCILISEGNATLVNNTFNSENVSFYYPGESNGTVLVQYYLDVNVTNGTDPLSGANVSIYNYTSGLVNSTLTGVTGFIDTYTLTEFWQNSTDTVYSTPHTINTTLAGYTTNSTIINLTETNSTEVDIVLELTPDDNLPNVTLISPADAYTNDFAFLINITFSCNATDDNQLQNISLYLTNSTNQSFALNQTTNIGGTSNSSNWTLELSTGNYTWNCLAYDSSSNFSWADANRTILLNYTAPIVTPSSGGGGGGGSSKRTIKDTNKTYTITEAELIAGYRQVLDEGDRIIFPYSGESHILTMEKIFDSYVKIIVESVPQTTFLDLGEDHYFEINDDDYYDVNVRLNYLNESGDITIIKAVKKISSDKPVVETPLLEEQPVEEQMPVVIGGAIALVPTDINYWPYLIGLIGFVVLILIIVGVYALIKRIRTTKDHLYKEPVNFEKQSSLREEPVSETLSLKDEYNEVNKRITELKESVTDIPHISGKLTKQREQRYNLEQVLLQKKLEKINARLHGYTKIKPVIIEASQRNLELQNELSIINKELTQLERLIPKQKWSFHRIKPTRTIERILLNRELNHITSLLVNSVREPWLLLKNLFGKPAKDISPEKLTQEQKATQEVRQISKVIEGREPMPSNELQDIERKLAKLRKELGEE